MIVREDRPGERRLVAYLVAPDAQTPPPDPRELRTFLGARLPDYMIPAAFVSLPSLPLTRTGKVDRRALPAPEAPAQASYTAPRTPFEVEIAEIWAELLKCERVGLQDSFWDLGGHSLLATRVLARVNAAFAVDLPLQTLFREPTLEGFAIAVAEAVMADLGEDEA